MKKYIFLAVAAVAFAACSNDEDQTMASDSGLIRLSSNIGTTQRVTRANLTDAKAQNTQFVSDKSVKVEVYKTGQSTAYSTDNYTTSNGSGAMTGSLYYPADGSNIDICAYYPNSVSSSTTSFNVGTTQTSAANYQSYDLMYATKLTNQAKSGSGHALTFNHALTKIIVNLSAGNGVADGDLTSYVTAVKLKSLKPTAGFTITGGAPGSITASGTAADVTITGDTKTSAHCAIIVPQQKSGAFIEVTYNGTAYTYSLASQTTFRAGKVYTYNISVNAAGISLSSNSITNWDSSPAAVNGSVTL